MSRKMPYLPGKKSQPRHDSSSHSAGSSTRHNLGTGLVADPTLVRQTQTQSSHVANPSHTHSSFHAARHSHSLGTGLVANPSLIRQTQTQSSYVASLSHTTCQTHSSSHVTGPTPSRVRQTQSSHAVRPSPGCGTATLLTGHFEHFYEYFWGINRFKNFNVGGKSYRTLDITLLPPITNTWSPDKTILVRKEYIAAYDNILARTQLHPKKSATLITGQTGNGKTLCLIYLLVLRLLAKEPVALQINSQEFVLFDHHGVSIHPAVTGHVPEGAWALSDSSPDRHGPCKAFEASYSHLIHMSSPTSCDWKSWAEDLNSSMFFMDVLSLEEFQVLLTINNFNVQAGIALFRKYGPNPRIIYKILCDRAYEAKYLSDVHREAAEFVHKFPAHSLDLTGLDFSADISSQIFALRPDFSNSREPVLTIPTPFLCAVLGVALSREAAAQQHLFFQTLKDHPSLRSAARWLFESYAHVLLSKPTRQPLEAFLSDDPTPNPHLIPVPRELISGSLTNIQTPYDFYWRPREPNFPDVDALIRKDNIVWALQFTIGPSSSSTTEGLTRVFSQMNHKTGVEWKLVIVGLNRHDLAIARDQHRLDGEWQNVPVYTCELPLGEFNEVDMQELQKTLDEISNEYPMDQRVGLDVSTNSPS